MINWETLFSIAGYVSLVGGVIFSGLIWQAFRNYKLLSDSQKGRIEDLETTVKNLTTRDKQKASQIEDLRHTMQGMTGYTQLHKVIVELGGHFDTKLDSIHQDIVGIRKTVNEPIQATKSNYNI